MLVLIMFKCFPMSHGPQRGVSLPTCMARSGVCRLRLWLGFRGASRSSTARTAEYSIMQQRHTSPNPQTVTNLKEDNTFKFISLQRPYLIIARLKETFNSLILRFDFKTYLYLLFKHDCSCFCFVFYSFHSAAMSGISYAPWLNVAGDNFCLLG